MQSAWQNLLTEIAGGDSVQGELSEAAYNFAETVITVVSNMIPRIIETAKGLFAAVPEFVQSLGEVIRENISSILPEDMANGVIAVMDTISSAISGIVEFIQPILASVQELFSSFDLGAVRSSEVFQSFQTTVESVLTAIQTAIQAFTDTVSSIWDAWSADIVEVVSAQRVHDLRHTAASFLATQATPKQVQDFLGHEDISTTMNIYTHLQDEDRKATSCIMDSILKNSVFCSEKCSEQKSTEN